MTNKIKNIIKKEIKFPTDTFKTLNKAQIDSTIKRYKI